MSLPQATKDISDNPASNSVTQPHDKREQAADVDRKLRFYGVVQALRESRMPSNTQIDAALTYALQHSPVDLNALSRDGQRLIHDTRDIIETARLMVLKKNADELFQNFVWHTRAVDTAPAKNAVNSDNIPVDQQKAKQDGQQAITHLRTLLSLVMTNAEVRKLVADFSVIGRDLLARGAGKLAETARPDDARLAQVDESAPSNQFVTEGGRVAGPDETPVSDMRLTMHLALTSRIYRSSRHAFLERTRVLPRTRRQSSARMLLSSRPTARSRVVTKPCARRR